MRKLFLGVAMAALLAHGGSALAGAPPDVELGAGAGGDRTAAAPVTADRAAAPVTVIRGLCAALIEVMGAGGQAGGEARYRALQPVIDRTFNLPLMTEIAVGARWSQLSPAEQRRLIDAFRRFTIASYVNHFGRNGGQRFEVRPDPQPVAGATLVLSQLVPRNKAPIALNYVMRQTDGGWQAIDVYADGTISELARRRSEFNDVLSRGGPDALADRLVERAQALIDQPA
jgi:phospholipid transport system substrate-binding protein